MPVMAIALKKAEPSPSLFSVFNVLAQVKKYPMLAPIALMSTNHPSASRPRIGPLRLTRMQKRMAFRGVPYFSFTFPNHSGRYPSLLIEYIRREEAR